MSDRSNINAEILNALREAAVRHQTNGPWTMPVAVTAVTGVIMFLVLPEILTPSRAAQIVVTGAVALAGVLLGLWEARLLKRYRTDAGERLLHSGVIERLALGWEQLTEIYDWVSVPWVLFLGPRPRSIGRTARLLAYNLDWYLREPQRLVRPQWVVYLLAGIIMPLVAVAIVWNPGGIVTGWFSGNFLPWLILCEMALIVPVSWVANHYQARQHIAAGLLLTEMQRRLRG